MDKIRGKVGEHFVDLDCISCPICYRKMEVRYVEPCTSERDRVRTDGFGGDISAYVTERNFPVTMRCPECGSTLRIELETTHIYRNEERQVKMVDIMAAVI